MERRVSTGPGGPRPGLVKAFLFLLSGLLVVALFIFTNRTINRLTSEVRATSRVLARFCAQASIPARSMASFRTTSVAHPSSRI